MEAPSRNHNEDPKEMSDQDELLTGAVMSDEGNDDDVELGDYLTPFAPIMAAIDLDRLSEFAVSVRTRYAVPGERSVSADGNAKDLPITCTVLSPPLAGSYNIIFPLLFSDGVRWMVKVPITGHKGRFDELAAQALASEAMTMRLIKRTTTIPVPQVYLFDTSLENEIHCPFVMMEYLQGQQLYELWFQRSYSEDTRSEEALTQFRTRVLQELAAAMTQLDALRYSQGGSLLFDQLGNVTGVGATRVVDFAAQVDRLTSDDTDGSPLFCVKGPFNDPKSFLTFALDRRESLKSLPEKYHQGTLQLLRQYIDWMPLDSHPANKSQFVLAHPDFALQNVLVSEEGAVLGIIDWDGAGAVPGCIAHYPLWLMRDWNPFMYNYDFEEGKPLYVDGSCEDTPDQLAYWRATYAQFMEKYSLELGSAGAVDNNYANSTGDLVQARASDVLVLRSPVFWSLALAADDPLCLYEILYRIFREIERLTAPRWGKSYPNLPSESTPVEDGEKPSFKLTCYWIRELFSFNTQFLHKNKAKKCSTGEFSKDTSLPTISEPAMTGSTEPGRSRIQKGLHATMDILQDKNVDGTEIKPQAATFGPAIIEHSQNKDIDDQGELIHKTIDNILGDTQEEKQQGLDGNHELHSTFAATTPGPNVRSYGRMHNSLRGVIGLTRPKRTKISGTDEQPRSVSVEAYSSKDAKPLFSKLRKVLKKPVHLLYKKKIEVTARVVEPRPAVVESHADEKAKSRHRTVRSILHRAFPCLSKPPSPADEKFDHLWEQFIRDYEDAGISAAKISKCRKSLEATIRIITQDLQEELSQVEAAASKEKARASEYCSTIFAQPVITDALVDNNISKAMMQRLKEGFDALVASTV